jgi:hypothetical protein
MLYADNRYADAVARAGTAAHLAACEGQIRSWDSDCAEILLQRAHIYLTRLEDGDLDRIESDLDALADLEQPWVVDAVWRLRHQVAMYRSALESP